MTSCLSDMRTVRPQGRTFRITQPHGLRVSYLGTLLGLCNGSNRISYRISRRLHVDIRDNDIKMCKIRFASNETSRLARTALELRQCKQAMRVATMTVTESKGLKKGNRVYWRGDATDSGTITETSWDAVTIAWDNGQVAIVHHGDMREIERSPARSATV